MQRACAYAPVAVHSRAQRHITCAGLNEHALNLLPVELMRLMCEAVGQGLKMLGDSAVWGTIMEAPALCQELPRRLPPAARAADAPKRAALLPSHLVNPAPLDDDAAREFAVFRSTNYRCVCLYVHVCICVCVYMCMATVQLRDRV